eukprot:TRINITY_DN32412_c0_g1_i1.p1 TRINITY_DN32412_c0_g1~~TRINITY_DN32412_c0_g1_i1.p1  ORF type:complete len:376 (-),score=55.47 TRINITY_DN32412_c0_g1_i1:380-1507(-)
MPMAVGAATWFLCLIFAPLSSAASMRGAADICSLPEDCRGSTCSEACCNRTDDFFCPNCQGADWECLTSRPQVGLGQAPALGATYNDFGVGGNAGFCRYQAPIAGQNKSSAYGSRLLSSHRVFAGVGLSQAQFMAAPGQRDGSIACGMCLEVTAKMALWDCDLTHPKDKFNVSKWPLHKVIVMVIDQCKDNWDLYNSTQPAGNCATGHLDFDIYPHDNNPGNLNIENVSWRAVDCPSDDLPIQFVFASNETSQWHFSVHTWDMRSPIKAMDTLAVCSNGSTAWSPMEFGSNGWAYQATKVCNDFAANYPDNVTFRLTSVYDEVIMENIRIPVGTWYQIDNWHAWPPIDGSRNFVLSKAAASAEANERYNHCRQRS